MEAGRQAGRESGGGIGQGTAWGQRDGIQIRNVIRRRRQNTTPFVCWYLSHRVSCRKPRA
eukprot:2527101-Heterocapsa_arctica.AAC.1